MGDRRWTRTEKQLQGAFFSLLAVKDVEHITIREITERADIGRGTFYLHYQDVYHLLRCMEDELAEQITGRLDALYQNGGAPGLEACIRVTAEYADSQRERFKLLMDEEKGGQLTCKLKRAFAERAQHMLADTPWADTLQDRRGYDLAFLISGAMGLLEAWIRDEKPLTAGQLAALVGKMLDGAGPKRAER